MVMPTPVQHSSAKPVMRGDEERLNFVLFYGAMMAMAIASYDMALGAGSLQGQMNLSNIGFWAILIEQPDVIDNFVVDFAVNFYLGLLGSCAALKLLWECFVLSASSKTTGTKKREFKQ